MASFGPSDAVIWDAFKKNRRSARLIPIFRLATDTRDDSFLVASVLLPYPVVRLFMILVAIFSVIVLLMCWLCYSGDCNN